MSFFKGIFSVVWIYAFFYLAYQFGFMMGHREASEAHGYRFENTQRAFAEAR